MRRFSFVDGLPTYCHSISRYVMASLQPWDPSFTVYKHADMASWQAERRPDNLNSILNLKIVYIFM